MAEQPILHLSVQQALRFFAFEHLPEPLKGISQPFHVLAWEMARTLPADPEVTAGLRKLREAKDCFVGLAALMQRQP